MESVSTPPTAPPRTPEQIRTNFRAFMLIWVAQLVARTGNGLTAFGLSVHVYQQSGLSTSVALVTMAAFLPAVLLAPFGGVLADRFDRRLLMILGDTLSAIGLVALLVAFSWGYDSVPVICACVGFSSVFSSVMDPAYRATVTDLLTPEQYARAGGLVQLASASQYLISPALAGLLMATAGITAVLMIDISTMALTLIVMLLVWRTVRTRPTTHTSGFWEDFRFGIDFLARHRGITILMVLITLVTFCMGFLQTLLTPMMLDLSDEATLGIIRSLAAIGMIVSSLAIGILNMGHRHLRYLSLGLVAGGILIALMGTTVNVVLLGALAFGFFMTLPPLNTSVEVLARSSIPNQIQGKVWGLMGLISQVGYLIAYAASGPLADFVFNPLLRPGGALDGTVVAGITGVGPSRGIALMFIVIGIIMIAVALVIPRVHSVQAIEQNLHHQMSQPKSQPKG